MSFKRILIAVDDEPVSAHAADVGVELARELGAEVALLNAVDIAPAFAAGISPTRSQPAVGIAR